MIDLEKIIRPNILKLKPYSCARDEFKGSEGIFLDANENPFGTLNRYPDPYQMALKQKLSVLKQVEPESIFIGNGSDEVIDLAYRIFCTPAKDKALTFSPTYGMYKVSAEINDVSLIELPLTNSFQINLEALKPYLKQKEIKLIFICSPNNPTGNIIKKEDIEYILSHFGGVVIIDEAYIDFATSDSLILLLSKYNNLIVTQTFSKAWGLAASRVGIAYSNKEVIALYNKVKPPYNVSTLNQKAALESLENKEIFEENLNLILKEKERMINNLKDISFVKKIYPSDANFLLIEVENANQTYLQLIERKIITRNRTQQIKNCIRITIGSPKENNQLIKALQEF